MVQIDFLQIVLSKKNKPVYFSGEVLSGEVIVKAKERVKVRGITLSISGQASVHW
jgi:hypothetical protein